MMEYILALLYKIRGLTQYKSNNFIKGEVYLLSSVDPSRILMVTLFLF